MEGKSGGGSGCTLLKREGGEKAIILKSASLGMGRNGGSKRTKRQPVNKKKNRHTKKNCQKFGGQRKRVVAHKIEKKAIHTMSASPTVRLANPTRKDEAL